MFVDIRCQIGVEGWEFGFELFNDFRFLHSKPGTRIYFGRILLFPDGFQSEFKLFD
jgi:hypothetical protein